MTSRPQSFENHRRTVPLYHVVLQPVLLLVALWFLYRTVTDFSGDHLVLTVEAVALGLTALFARVFPLGVQDRLIRLEERLRMARLLPEELRDRVDELTVEHLVGLRFASDEELAGLVRRVLDGELEDREAIKRAVRSWRADHQRI